MTLKPIRFRKSWMLSPQNNDLITRRDIGFMRKAIDLAAAGQGQTGGNPSVGCVLVKAGIIIGQAATAKGGRPHAETQALDLAGAAARGATAYVTLEPCSHHGQTGPCCEALIEAGITRCIISVIDPDPRVNWRGAAKLQEAGVDTVIGCLTAEASIVMQSFLARASSA